VMLLQSNNEEDWIEGVEEGQERHSPPIQQY
jgi:hypothetical protein